MLKELIKFHRQAEEIIARQVAEICARTCGACAEPCCHEDVCIEADNSYFLSLIRDPHCRKNNHTWLGENGCTLTHGRPLFCRDFFCHTLLAESPEKIVAAREFIADWKQVYKNFAGSRSLLVVEQEKITAARIEKTMKKSEKFRKKWMAPDT